MLHKGFRVQKHRAWALAVLSAVFFFQGVSGCAIDFSIESDSSSSVDSQTAAGDSDTGTSADTGTGTGADTATGVDTHADTAADTDTGSAGDSEMNTDTGTDTGCPVGYQGADCAQACESIKLDIASCSNISFDCSPWIDGDPKNETYQGCEDGGENCLAINYDFDLGDRFYVNRLRFLSDWFNKRPGTWDLLASDDGVNFSLVMSARSNRDPWRCVQDEPCTSAVPEVCCPGGIKQDTSSVGDNYPKWDDFGFTGVVARHWRFRIKSTDDPLNLIMREFELYGNSCLGSRCEASNCDTGVCTEKGEAFCMCAACEPPGSCTSAFVGDGPGCTTPEL